MVCPGNDPAIPVLSEAANVRLPADRTIEQVRDDDILDVETDLPESLSVVADHRLGAVVGERTDSDHVLDRSRSALHKRFGVDHATIQIESPAYSHTVSLDCHAPDRDL